MIIMNTIHKTQIMGHEMRSNPFGLPFGNVLVSFFSAEVLTTWIVALTRIPIALVPQRTSHVSRRRNPDPDMAAPWISS